MSGIYIPGMKMPTTGLYLVSVDSSGGKDETVITVRRMLGSRDICLEVGAYNLIPVPDHGDLIDRDELTEITEKVYDHFKNGDEITTQEATIAYVFATGVINNAQTIIPADKEGEG